MYKTDAELAHLDRTLEERIDPREPFPNYYDDYDDTCDCPHCKGSGHHLGVIDGIKCAYCGGTGIFTCERCGHTYGRPHVNSEGNAMTHLGCTMCQDPIKETSK